METNLKKPEQAAPESIVKIANGAGNEPIEIVWREGDTVASVLKRANITIEPGRTATIGRQRISKPKKTEVRPGEVIVIAGKPSNG